MCIRDRFLIVRHHNHGSSGTGGEWPQASLARSKDPRAGEMPQAGADANLNLATEQPLERTAMSRALTWLQEDALVLPFFLAFALLSLLYRATLYLTISRAGHPVLG